MPHFEPTDSVRKSEIAAKTIKEWKLVEYTLESIGYPDTNVSFHGNPKEQIGFKRILLAGFNEFNVNLSPLKTIFLIATDLV